MAPSVGQRKHSWPAGNISVENIFNSARRCTWCNWKGSIRSPRATQDFPTYLPGCTAEVDQHRYGAQCLDAITKPELPRHWKRHTLSALRSDGGGCWSSGQCHTEHLADALRNSNNHITILGVRQPRLLLIFLQLWRKRLGSINAWLATSLTQETQCSCSFSHDPNSTPDQLDNVRATVIYDTYGRCIQHTDDGTCTAPPAHTSSKGVGHVLPRMARSPQSALVKVTPKV